MAIQDNYAPVKTIGDGSTVAFSYDWDVSIASYLRVNLQLISTGDLTLQILDSDYTLEFDEDGGIVTFNTAPSNLNNVIISRETEKNQSDTYSTAKGFQGLKHENSLDKVTAITQDICDTLTRVPKFKFGSDTENVEIDDLDPNKFLVANPEGDGITNSIYGDADIPETTDDLEEGDTNLYDKVVVLTEGVGIDITSDYPNFVIKATGVVENTDKRVSVSSADITTGFLETKITSDNSTVDLTITDPAGNETLDLSVSTDFFNKTTDDTDDITDTATNRFTSDTDITRLANTSGTNTGDQDLSGFVPYIGATANVDLGLFNLNANKIIVDSDLNYGDNTGYWFGDGNTGFYENIDNSLMIHINNQDRWRVTSVFLGSSNSAQAGIVRETASVTNPVFIINSNFLNTGIGGSSAGQLSLISNSIEVVRVEEDLVTINGDIWLTEDGDAVLLGVSQDVSIDYDTNMNFNINTTGDFTFNGGKLIVDSDLNYGTDTGYWFSDGNMGFYEKSVGVLGIHLNSLPRYEMTQSFFNPTNKGNSWLLKRVLTSATEPVHTFVLDSDTGIGSAGDNQLSLIAGGIEIARLEEDLVTINNNMEILEGSLTIFGEEEVRDALILLDSTVGDIWHIGADATVEGNGAFYISVSDISNADVIIENNLVGIGIAPTEKLEVNGNIFLSNDSDKLLLGAGQESERYYDNTNLIENLSSGMFIYNSTIKAPIFLTDTAISKPDWEAGQIWYDSVSKTNVSDTGYEDVRVNIGQEMHFRIYNNTASDWTNGQIATVSTGTTNGILNGILADSATIGAKRVGMLTMDIPMGSSGLATIGGEVNDIDTTGFADSVTLFLSDTPGEFTDTLPLFPLERIIIGKVLGTGSSSGAVQINTIYRTRTVLNINYPFTSNGVLAGVYYAGGNYTSPSTSTSLTQASTTQTFGLANVAHGAHAFAVCGGAGVVDTGVVGLRVNGTSITDDGVRTTGDSEILTNDITSQVIDDYIETPKKWLGTITFELFIISGTPTAYSLDFNYGFAKYADAANRDFTVTSLVVNGLAGANDTNFDIELLKHGATGWTYTPTGFIPGDGAIIQWSVDNGTEKNLANNNYFSWDRKDLLEYVEGGSNEEGIIIRITCGANNSVQFMNAVVSGVSEGL